MRALRKTTRQAGGGRIEVGANAESSIATHVINSRCISSRGNPPACAGKLGTLSAVFYHPIARGERGRIALAPSFNISRQGSQGFCQDRTYEPHSSLPSVAGSNARNQTRERSRILGKLYQP